MNIKLPSFILQWAQPNSNPCPIRRSKPQSSRGHAFPLLGGDILLSLQAKKEDMLLAWKRLYGRDDGFACPESKVLRCTCSTQSTVLDCLHQIGQVMAVGIMRAVKFQIRIEKKVQFDRELFPPGGMQLAEIDKKKGEDHLDDWDIQSVMLCSYWSDIGDSFWCVQSVHIELLVKLNYVCYSFKQILFFL